MKLLVRHCLIVLLALFGFGASSCMTPTDAQETQSVSSEPATSNVNIKLFHYNPEAIEVSVGTMVVWTNGDAVDHTVTHGTPDAPAGTFNSGSFNQGKTFSFTFTEAGEYPYFCARHDFMRGSIKVVPAP